MKPNLELAALGLVLLVGCGGKVNTDDFRNPVDSHDSGDPPPTETPAASPSAGSAAPGSAAPGSADPTTSNGNPGGDMTDPGPAAGPPWLAFDSDRGGVRGIYLVRSDGTGLVRLTNSPAVEMEPAFSADGKKLAFVSNATGHFQIHILDFATYAQAPLTHRPGGAHQPAWSHDGSLLAFTGIPEGLNLDAGIGTHPAPGVADLFVIGSSGGGEHSVIGAFDGPAFYPEYYPANPVFGPDPKTIVVAGDESIRAIGLDGQGLREIAGCPTEGTETPSVSPDGAFVAFASWDGKGQGIRVTSYVGDSKDPAHDGLSKLIVGPQDQGGVTRHPAWGPTNLIAYEAGVYGEPANLAIVPATGGVPQSLTTGSSDNRNPAWAPIGFDLRK